MFKDKIIICLIKKLLGTLQQNLCTTASSRGLPLARLLFHLSEIKYKYFMVENYYCTSTFVPYLACYLYK